MWAMKPRPQASCSFAGSYSPCRAGGQVRVILSLSVHVDLARYGPLAPPRPHAAERGLQRGGRNLSILAAMLHCGNRPPDLAARNSPPDVACPAKSTCAEP